MWQGPKESLVVLRDAACLGLGGWGVVNEQLSPDTQLPVLGFFAMLAIAPGMFAAHWLGAHTGSPSSSPPSESPPSSSPSSASSRP